MAHVEHEHHSHLANALCAYVNAKLDYRRKELEHDAEFATGLVKLKAQMWLDNWDLVIALEQKWGEWECEIKECELQDRHSLQRMTSRCR